MLSNQFSYKGRVKNINELPNDTEIGDMYFVGIYDYVYDGKDWVRC